MRQLLRRCLERNPRNRLHDIADARLVLEELRRGGMRRAAGAARRRARRSALAGAVALAAVAAAALVAAARRAASVRLRAARGAAVGVRRFAISSARRDDLARRRQLPRSRPTAGGWRSSAATPTAGAALDPELDQVRARPLAGTEGAS